MFLQIATPSRERVEHYSRLRAEIEQTVGRINGDHSRIGLLPLNYLHQSLPRDELTAFYLAADVMLVTPLRDGMNLVAKEYIACRHDDGGVLVLSEFTGAARELTSALLVNPHDIDGVKSAVVRALEMPPDEARRRMRTLRRHVKRHDVDQWAHEFLDAPQPHHHRRHDPALEHAFYPFARWLQHRSCLPSRAATPRHHSPSAQTAQVTPATCHLPAQ